MEVEPRYIQEDVRINRFKLEEECDRHPSIYFYWAEKLAEVKAETDHLTAREKYLRAKAAHDLRTNPPDGRKLTEAGIAEETELNGEVQKVSIELNEKKKQRYHLEAAVESMNNRKRELDNLVDLYIRGYYQTPNGRKPSTDDVQEAHRNRLNENRKIQQEEE